MEFKELVLSLEEVSISGIVFGVLYFAGFACAILALWRARTPQGSIAWIVALTTMPIIALPLFVALGRSRFSGYIRERKELDAQSQNELDESDELYAMQVSNDEFAALNSLAQKCRQPGFTKGNITQLLVDGNETFKSMLDAIDAAEEYILIQFYIFRLDRVGRKFTEALRKKRESGVKVYFMFDAIGSFMSKKNVKILESYGFEVANFRSTKPWSTRFQINFRNHRKNLVVDGKIAFVGGLNIGDDYLGRWRSIGPWRDTHIRLEGPSALAAQLAFVKDWYWVKERIPDLDWKAKYKKDGSDVLVLHTGPADDLAACLLAHIHLINLAERRLWIASPYFVPPEGILDALILAKTRGVDVRVMIPSKSDNLWVTAASKVFHEKGLAAGIRFFEYLPGFLHQKVILVDDKVGVVGSANLDQRSMFINFEITACTLEKDLVISLEQMLQRDFQNSQEVTTKALERRLLVSQLFSRAVSLFAPIL